MAVAPTVQKYLKDRNIEYEAIPHQATTTSSRTAEVCGVSGNCLAKGIVLRTGQGYMLAVVPASHHLRLAEVATQLGKGVGLAAEEEIERLLAIAPRYGIEILLPGH